VDNAKASTYQCVSLLFIRNYVTLSLFICGVNSNINLVKSSPLGLFIVRKQRLYD
jgi:hypothetical protein